MKSKRRRRYKKKKPNILLRLKIALIFYVAIFGVGYMSSDTTAYLSSQSEVSQTITAEWEVPVVSTPGLDSCGDADSSEESMVDCEDIDDMPVEGEEKDQATEDEIATEQENQKSDELGNADNEGGNEADLDVDTEMKQEIPEVDDQIQPNGQDESINESNENKPNNNESINESNENKPNNNESVEVNVPEVSTETKNDDEPNASEKADNNTEKAEGDTNEEAEGAESAESNEVDQ